MKKQILIVILLLLMKIPTVFAQAIGVKGSINHTSNGINLYYSQSSKNNEWNYDAGIRIMVNTYSLNNNFENYAFYQTGYANSFSEHFGLNFGANRKIISYKWMRLDAMSNLLLARHSLLYKNNAAFTDIPTEKIYQKPAPVIELTLGLLMQAEVSPKVVITGSIGVGYAWFFYHNEEEERNIKGLLPTGLQKPNNGNGEFIGLDCLPTLSLGVKYKM